MPHLHLETTADLPENAAIPDILGALVVRLGNFESILPASIKAYHTMRVNWAVGEGAPPGFAHLTVAIMTGRPLALRQQIADGILEEFRTHFAMSLEQGEVKLTLEVREMESDTYKKWPT